MSEEAKEAVETVRRPDGRTSKGGVVMTDNARERIAGELAKRMRDMNKWYLTATPEEVAATLYLSGAEMVLRSLDVPYRTEWDTDAKRYTSLTLDGVTYSVEP